MNKPHSRSDIEEFLYHEARLLDSWQLDRWLALFTDDASYHVPSIGLSADASPNTALFYIADDRFRLGERVSRLSKRTAHAEHPRSRTRHFVSNVLIESQDEIGLRVSAAFMVHRFKNGETDVYVGFYQYLLVPSDGAYLIKSKRSILDMDALRPHGRLSILL
ncbi:aromatic-ring-hydroxylating dioxygenase subunit beta [Paraburkholderia sediminicola]|uniref:aromatic-ring-hydroxylating dioxygenase subunit beta n=1 Tax=Paraburkholderia sediminicola TaxID=458836 RepID=UPI0038BD8FC4